MKKLNLLILLILCLATAIIGCGRKKEENADNVQMEVVSIEEISSEEEVVLAKEYTKGTLNGNQYSSNWLELEFTAPENTELSVMNNSDASLIEGEKILSKSYSKELIDQTVSNVECEMICVANDSDATVSVIVEHMGEAKVTTASYLATLKMNLSSINDKSISYNVSDSTTSVILAGSTYEKLSTKVSSGNKSLIQDYLVKSVDSEIVGVIFTYPDTDEGRSAYKLLYESFDKK